MLAGQLWSPTIDCNEGNTDIIIVVGRISIESIPRQMLFIETENRQPNSEGDERHHPGINPPQNHDRESTMHSFSSECAKRGAEYHDEGEQERDLAGNEFTQEASCGVDQGDDQTATDSDARWNFQDVDQERREDEVSRTQKSGEHAGDNRK